MLRLLGSLPTDDPTSMLSAYLQHLQAERPTLLSLVDGGEALPRKTAAWVGDLIRASDGALR